MGCLKLNIENPASLRVFNGWKSTVSKNDVKAYRYGYQGSEKDDEVKGQGNSYTTEYRQLDVRIGRWLTIDPLNAKYPGMSPYTSMNNNPITTNDQLGLEGTDWGRSKKGKYKWYDSEEEAKADLGDDFVDYYKPGEVYKSILGNVELGEKTWGWTEKEATIPTLYSSDALIDNSYAMSQLKKEENHKRLVANAKALDDFVTDYTLIMTAPLTSSYKLINAFIGGAANLGNQLAANGGDWGEVDVLSVGVSAGAGLVTGRPIIGNISATAVDALVDVKTDPTGYKVESIFLGNKKLSTTLNDALWIGLGNLGSYGAAKQGIPSIISNPITGFPTTVINYNSNKALE